MLTPVIIFIVLTVAGGAYNNEKEHNSAPLYSGELSEVTRPNENLLIHGEHDAERAKEIGDHFYSMMAHKKVTSVKNKEVETPDAKNKPYSIKNIKEDPLLDNIKKNIIYLSR